MELVTLHEYKLKRCTFLKTAGSGRAGPKKGTSSLAVTDTCNITKEIMRDIRKASKKVTLFNKLFYYIGKHQCVERKKNYFRTESIIVCNQVREAFLLEIHYSHKSMA